ncbi:hypothetical protein ACHQM5_017404 [Ranunculus cassubicifolius]
MSKLYVYSVSMLFLFFKITTLIKAQKEENLIVELAGSREEKVSSVVVNGTVVCKACFDVQLGLHILPSLGTVVAISCRNSNWVQTRTNENGDFSINLPYHFHGISHLEKACIVKVLQLPKESPCRLPIRRLTRIKLSSSSHKVRTYTIGRIRLQHTSKHAPKCLKKQTDVEDAKRKTH